METPRNPPPPLPSSPSPSFSTPLATAPERSWTVNNPHDGASRERFLTVLAIAVNIFSLFWCCITKVPEDVKADRLQRVMRLGCAHAQERSERYLGRLEEVLVEERNPKNASQVFATALEYEHESRTRTLGIMSPSAKRL